MTRIREIKTTFTAGEVGRDLLGRGDLRAYENGALAHVALLIRMADWAGQGAAQEEDVDLAELLENARNELKNHKEYQFDSESD